MEKKFLTFLEIARALNRHDIVPILYGSLGLYRIIGELSEVNDIDIVVPEIYLKEKFSELAGIMTEIRYKQDSMYPHEFTGRDHQIGFESKEEIEAYEGVNFSDFKITKIDDAEFKELSAEDYLVVYKKNLKFREEKIKDMKPKIKALEEFLRNKQ